MELKVGNVYKLTDESGFVNNHSVNVGIAAFIKKHSSKTIKLTDVYLGHEECVGGFVNGDDEKYTSNMRCKLTKKELDAYFTEVNQPTDYVLKSEMTPLSKLVEIYKKNGGTKSNPTKNELIKGFTEYTKKVEAEAEQVQKMKDELNERVKALEEMKAVL